MKFSAVLLLVTILERLPLSFRIHFGRLVGWLISWLPTKDRRIAWLQMKWILGDQARPVLIRRMYMNLCQNVFESINLAPILDNHEQYIRTEGWDRVEELKSTKKPIVCLTAHTGNWDLLAAYCIRRGLALVTIGKEARRASWQKLLSSIREGYGIRTIWRSDPNALNQIREELKGRSIIAALIDQDTEVGSSFVPFFGQPARSPSGLIAVAKRSGAEFAAAFIARNQGGTSTVFIHRIDSTLSIEEILSSFHKLLEDYIQRYPDQWVWVHKRWRSLASGERLSSRNYIEYLTSRLSNDAT